MSSGSTSPLGQSSGALVGGSSFSSQLSDTQADRLAFSAFFVEQKFASMLLQHQQFSSDEHTGESEDRSKSPFSASSRFADDASTLGRSTRGASATLNTSLAIKYQRNRVFLTYHDAETEARYVDYMYGRSLSFGTVVYYLLLVGVAFNLIADMMSSTPIVIIGCIAIALVCAGCVISFSERLAKWRETFGNIVMSWAIVIATTFAFHNSYKFPVASTVATLFFVSVLVPPCRFVRVLFVVPTVSVLSLLVITFEADFWDNVPYTFLLWCPVLVFVLGMHRVLEQLSRTSFEQIDTSTEDLRAIDAHVMGMQHMIAGFFPPTAALGLLAKANSNDGGGDNDRRRNSAVMMSAAYPETVMVVTDAVGFTSWANRTLSTTVIEMLGQLLVALDRAAPTHGVEKLCTVGDSFVGVIFPSASGDTESTAHRSVSGIRFALEAAAIPSRLGIPLQNRVGVHIGDVVGGFVGLSPLGFDLFGFALHFAKHMESTGEGGKVHASVETMVHASTLGRPVNYVETEEGIIFCEWEDEVDGGDNRMNETAARLAQNVVDVGSRETAARISRELLKVRDQSTKCRCRAYQRRPHPDGNHTDGRACTRSTAAAS
eukprot:PhM_4_TR10039/c2_g2_i1/m.38705